MSKSFQVSLRAKEFQHNARQAKGKSISVAFCGVGGAGLILLKCKFAQCEYKARKNRLIGNEVVETETDSHFSWKQFFDFLWPDIWLLAAAIVVSN